MSIIQMTFDVPEDIATGVATGLYKMHGGVVRYAYGPDKGKIIKHLKPIDVSSADKAQRFGANLLQMAERHKKEISIVAIGTAAVGLGVVFYFRWKSREPKALSDFRVELRRYIYAIRKGKMDIETINNLMSALERLKNHKDFDKIYIQLSAEELQILVGRIYEYTLKLAADNSFKITENEMKMGCGILSDLQSYLEVQKQLFEMVA